MLFYPFHFKFIPGTLSNAKSENKDVLENDPAVYDYPSSPGTLSSFQAKKTRADELVEKVIKLESKVDDLIKNADVLYKEFITKFMYFLLFSSVFFFILGVLFYSFE